MTKNSSHQSHESLSKILIDASKNVLVGGIYRHYKYPDRVYKVLMLAVQEATEKICVIYQDIAHPDAPPFVRDLDSWVEHVEWEGEQVPRFLLLNK